jgi:hypothetical protein
MNKIIFGICITIVACFISCADNEADQNYSLSNNDSVKPVTIAIDSQKVANSSNPFPGPVHAPGVLFPKPTATQASSSTNVAVLNPAHGQPNHRCDIAVGAPLNSPATNPVTQTNATTPTASPAVQPATAPAQKTTSKTITPPGMNPPHGEPEHRCEIAVGAPLNSPVTKPSNQTVSTKPATSPAIKKTTAPAQTKPAKTITPPGMNPPHGEAGHRCDIAVGAPLSSPAKSSPKITTAAQDTSSGIASPKKGSGI